MANLSFIIGIIGNVVSILVFASPIKTFWWVVKKKSTENYKGVPYITTLLSTSLGTFYGLLKPGGLLIATVNGAGAVLQLIYIILFIIYAPKDRKIKTAKLAALLDIGFLGSVIGVTLFAIHQSSLRVTFIGILNIGLTTCMYASPLCVMGMVIKTKSVEYMPFLLSFSLFLNGGVWSLYALLVKDIFIGIPNAIGFVLGSVQLILYAMYKNRSTSTKPTGETMEVEDEVSTQVVKKNGIEMHVLDKVGEANTDFKTFSEGNSVPKPKPGAQKSLKNIVRTLTRGPYELQHYSTSSSSSSFKSPHESDPTGEDKV